MTAQLPVVAKIGSRLKRFHPATELAGPAADVGQCIKRCDNNPNRFVVHDVRLAIEEQSAPR
jgi:hypothetical protein